MAESMISRLRRVWNVFSNKDPTYYDFGNNSSYRPDRTRITNGNERTIINSVINRIAIDCASIDIFHVRVNDEGNYIEKIDSGLNYCLTESANLDQTGRAFRQDLFMSLLDEGCIAVVPVETDNDPTVTGSYNILSLRVGKILSWYPDRVKVRLYDERVGQYQEVTISKRSCAILENPLYSVMNEPNSTLKRLVRKLAILDYIDEQSGSGGKLNLIVQLPYSTRSELKQQQAELRRREVEDQLVKSKYGIAYTDGVEKITQLNRPIENNLMSQIEYLTNQLFSQLGMTQAILDGTADEQALLNYHNSTIEPIISVPVDEFRRKFLTKTARSQKQDIMFFRDPFKLIPVSQIAEISDKLTRNEIMSSNEVRQKICLKPSDDPRADELRNKNINQSNEELLNTQGKKENSEEDGEKTKKKAKGLLNIPLNEMIQKE